MLTKTGITNSNGTRTTSFGRNITTILAVTCYHSLPSHLENMFES